MSTSIILLDQNFNANNVDIMVFEPSVLFRPATVWGGGVVFRKSLTMPKKTERGDYLVSPGMVWYAGKQ